MSEEKGKSKSDAKAGEDSDTDTLFEIRGKLLYSSFSRWLGADIDTEADTGISSITLEGNENDNEMHLTVHTKGSGPDEVLKAFGGTSDDLRIPTHLKTYILYREWYSRLDTEPCIDVLLYSEKKEEFGLIVVDIENPMLIFPGFIWKVPAELVQNWLTKRAVNAYRTAFEFRDVAAWLDHEITNSELQPSLILNYEDGLSICISGTNKIDEIRARDTY